MYSFENKERYGVSISKIDGVKNNNFQKKKSKKKTQFFPNDE